ncbi:EexN family lipoprotein [Rhizobium beringeri]
MASCSQESERRYTVDELLADEALLSHTISDCRGNPGELRNTVNCQNAEAADGKRRLQKHAQSAGRLTRCTRYSSSSTGSSNSRWRLSSPMERRT